MQISIAILLRTLFPCHTIDNVLLAHHGNDNFQIFKITIKDQNWFKSAKLGLTMLVKWAPMVDREWNYNTPFLPLSSGRMAVPVESDDRSMTEPGAVISRSSSATRLSDQLLKAAFGIRTPSGGAAGRHDQYYTQSSVQGEFCECIL